MQKRKFRKGEKTRRDSKGEMKRERSIVSLTYKDINIIFNHIFS